MTNLIGVATVTGEANKQVVGAKRTGKLSCALKDGSLSNFVALDGSQWVWRALSHVPGALVAFPCFVAVKVAELVVQQLQQLLEAHKGPCKFLIVLDNQECRNPVKQETAAARYGKNPATFKDVAETLRQAGEPAKLAKRESLLDRAKSQFKITVKRLDPAVVAFVVYRIGLCIPERLL